MADRCWTVSLGATQLLDWREAVETRDNIQQCVCVLCLSYCACVLQGAYTLTLEFESKLELSQWEERLPKIQSFFGPGELPWRLWG